MRFQEVEIGIEQVSAGMYVCRLDRSWNGAPFPLQGFLVDADDQLDWLRANCRSVWIDIERGLPPKDVPLQQSKRRAPVEVEPLVGSVRYKDQVSFAAELPAAREAHDNATRLAQQIIDDVRAGHKLAPADVRAASEPIVESVLRSADTMFWVNALQRHGTYAYSHAINCCALAAAFGRHLGLPAELLVDLASGGLLLDVGKARLPEDLLGHAGPLDAATTTRMRDHVSLSQKILDESGEHSHELYEMIRTHHERWDGSGYPAGLHGTSIPLFGRMAAIIDSFDAMTSERPHAKAIARHEALQHLYRSRETLFQGELVEQFTGCLGVYPTGSLVELSTGEVAIVMTQNTTRRLRPLVMLLTDAHKNHLAEFRPLDLMQQPEGVPLKEQINIIRPLPVGAHGLDPAELYL